MSLIKSTISYFHSQWFTKLPYPTHSFDGLTILVTGGNSGLGLEAARHFVRLNAARVIIAVRNIERGTAAARSIAETTQRPGVVEVWELDLASYASVQAFAARVNSSLDRLDIVVENAGVSSHTFHRAEDNEMIVTINFVSTMLLGFLLLPKLRKTAEDHGKEVVLTFVGSFLHKIAKFPQQQSDDMFKELGDESKADMSDRYNTVKLMLLLAVRELAVRTTQPKGNGRITISLSNPGSVITNMGKDNGIMFDILRKAVFRETEAGSRTLVHSAEGGADTHGQYLNDCKIGRPSEFVVSSEGAKVQQRLWDQLVTKLEGIHPGISQDI